MSEQTQNKRNTIIAVSIAAVGTIILLAFVLNSLMSMRTGMELSDKMINGEITYSEYCDAREKRGELSMSEKIDCIKANLR